MQEDWELELKVKHAGGVPLCLDWISTPKMPFEFRYDLGFGGILYWAAIRKTMYRVLDPTWGLESFKQ